MSILDTIKNLASGHTQLTGFVGGVEGFISQQGGLGGLKAKFEKEGAGSILQSWVSTGPNLPISEDQVQKVMGNHFVTEMAAKMGVDPATAKQKISQMLPKLVDSISPNGQLPEKIDTKSLMAAASQLATKH